MMQTRVKRARALLLIPPLLLLAALVLAGSPEEKTLGAGIRPVYVHVALLGSAGVFMAGTALIGGLALLRGGPRWPRLAQRLALTALLLFTGALGMSVIAARVNWGAMSWEEPKTVASLQVIALGIIVLIIASWVPWPRVRALLYSLWAVISPILLFGAERVLHPSGAITNSGSGAIRLTFVILISITLLVAGIVLLVLGANQRDSTVPPA
jgi:amino acid permease